MRASNPRARAWVPSLVLLGTLLLTVVATAYSATLVEQRDRLRFENAVGEVQQRIENRLDTYVALLRAGSGLFAASDALDREAFHAFVERLQLEQRYPGVQGIGFSVRVPPEGLPALETAMRAQGVSDFHVWPEEARPIYHAIIYLEPTDRRNQAAIGYDMFTEPTRRAAMERARDTGLPAASGKVTLVQEIDEQKQAGFLIYYPVYRDGALPQSVEARRQSLVGHIYSPFRAGDLLNSVLLSQVDRIVAVQVYDGEAPAADALMYDSEPEGSRPRTRYSAERRIEVAGRPWTLRFSTRPAFERLSERNLVPAVFFGGVALSLLLFFITRAQVRARMAAEATAVKLRASREALRASATRFRTLVEQAPLSIQIFNPDGSVARVNRAWERLWGVTVADLPGYNILQDQQLEHKGIMPYIRRGFAGEATSIPPIAYVPDRGEFAGQPRWVSAFIYPVKDETERIREVVLVHEDISERKQAQDALSLLAEAGAVLSSTLDYETTMQSLAKLLVPTLADYCVVLALDDEGQIRQVTSAHADPAKEPLLHELGTRYPYSASNPHSFVAQALARGEPLLYPTVPPRASHLLTQDERVLALYDALAPHSFMVVPLTARGRTLGAVSLMGVDPRRPYNEGDLRVVQELARRAALAVDNARLYQEAQEAIRVRDQFLSIASHDLKTPITSVKGYADLLLRRAERDGAGDPKMLRGLTIIQEEAQRLNRLVELLLDVSRIQSNRLELERRPVDLHALTRRLVEIMQAGSEGHRLHLLGDEGPLRVKGDELRLEQVLQNLLQNAIKYSPAGGNVWVTLACGEGRACITVRDEGVGIPPDAVPRLFTRFFRAENVESLGVGGQGLGLYIVHHIVEAHGGTVTVDSRLGEGSTFTVELPLLAQAGEGVKG